MHLFLKINLHNCFLELMCFAFAVIVFAAFNLFFIEVSNMYKICKFNTRKKCTQPITKGNWYPDL